jgi:hypothetical protein
MSTTSFIVFSRELGMTPIEFVIREKNKMRETVIVGNPN